MNKVVFRKGMYLCFVLQATERVRENNAVVILLERATGGFGSRFVALSFAPGRKQRVPDHAKFFAMIMKSIGGIYATASFKGS